ncbi:protein sidekick-like, partial [Tropilaelaps mercedesae]
QDAVDSLNLVALGDVDATKTTDLTLTTVKSKLYIDCASADDEAEYTCVATSADRTESASYKLQVSRSPSPLSAIPVVCRRHAKKSHHLSTPARITMWTHNKLVPMGSSALLVCRAQGSNAAITWINEETQMVISDSDSDRIHVRDNGDLELKNIQWSDMGGYACQAENEAGTDREVAFLYPYAV